MYTGLTNSKEIEVWRKGRVKGDTRLSLIFYLLSYFILRWRLCTKNNQWRLQFLHTYSQGTFHIPTSRTLLQMELMENQHDQIWKTTAVDTEQIRNVSTGF